MFWGFVTACQTIIIYILLIVPLEYFLTEYFFVFSYIPANTKTIIFLIVFLLVFFVNKKLFDPLKYGGIVFALFILTLFGYAKYQQYYSYLQTFPKIKSVSSNWTIQGKKIIIKGKNFGDPHDQAKVEVGEIIFLIDKWTHTKIIARQPITNDYGDKKLQITLPNGNSSRVIPFEIRDPADLET